MSMRADSNTTNKGRGVMDYGHIMLMLMNQFVSLQEQQLLYNKFIS